MEPALTLQLGLMLFLSGICGCLAFLTVVTKSLSPKRKTILVCLEVASTLLLLCDCFAYLFRGDTSDLGFWMVRVSNGMVFLLTITIPYLVTRYLRDLLRNEGGLAQAPRELYLCDVVFVVGVVLIAISQFTGLYYTFDAQNNYQRAPGFVYSYIFPLLIVVLQEYALIRHRKHLGRALWVCLTVCVALPVVASFVQAFAYGLSLINITLAITAIVFFVHALRSLCEEVEHARVREIELQREAQEKELELFKQTAAALANAIDAKDRYTRGHSARVARYSRLIAERAGLPEDECKKVYFAALLHDVGKIGVRNDILNKVGKLSDEEFEEVKAHTVLGCRILSSIRNSPFLRDGAHYHHERYDGTGYPEGLSGEDIPECARIIAVADAYDSMTSTRSYRDSLAQERVREELANGVGTQFDPRFATIMLQLIDEDCGFLMREKGQSSDLLPALDEAVD